MSVDSISTQTPSSRQAAMTPKELAALIADHPGDRTNTRAARMIGVNRVTVQRWLSGARPIGTAYASLIREKLGRKLPKRVDKV